jgi:hypothetical protein
MFTQEEDHEMASHLQGPPSPKRLSQPSVLGLQQSLPAEGALTDDE